MTTDGEQIHLPLLKDLAENLHIGKVVKDPESIMVIGYQHYLNTFVELVSAIHYLGVPWKQIYCCGKNYSYDESVHQKLHALGVHSYGCNKVTIPGTFQKTMNELIDKMLKKAEKKCAAKKCKIVVTINDGFCLIEKAAKVNWGEAKLVGVLQTGSIHYSIENLDHPIPIVDIAYSAASRALSPCSPHAGET